MTQGPNIIGCVIKSLSFDNTPKTQIKAKCKLLSNDTEMFSYNAEVLLSEQKVGMGGKIIGWKFRPSQVS